MVHSRLRLGTACAAGVALFAGTMCMASAGAASVKSGPHVSSRAAGCVATANQAIAAASKPAEFKVGSAIKIKSLKGKTIDFVADDMANPADVVVYSGFQAAAKVAHFHVRSFDGMGSDQGYVQAMNEAIDTHPSAIVFHGIDPDLIGGPIATAKKDGIKLVGSDEPVTPGIYVTDRNNVAIGDLQGDYALSSTSCNANVLILYSSVFSSIVQDEQGAVNTIAKLCPNCTVQTLNIPVTTLATAAGPSVTAALEANPTINFVISTYDPLSTFVIPAIQSYNQQTGKSIVLDSQGGLATLLTNNVATQTIEDADILLPQAWLGWIDLDQTMREMLKVSPSKEDELNPFQFVDGTNIAAVLKVKDYLPGYVNLAKEYEHNWGLN